LKQDVPDLVLGEVLFALFVLFYLMEEVAVVCVVEDEVE
jgi:hypothetical protein